MKSSLGVLDRFFFSFQYLNEDRVAHRYRCGSSRSSYRPFLERLEDRRLPSGMPALSSLPGASATIFLDFGGHFESQWDNFSNVSTPVFDIDGNPAISDQEAAIITEVWQRVAEDYSPFAVNVSTVNPGQNIHGKDLVVAIGGSYSDWFGDVCGGVADVGSFMDTSLVNTVYIFPSALGNNPKTIAVAAAHEAGHAFGLEHQSSYDSNGNLTQEYNPGDSRTAPIMGGAYYSERSLWWNGPNDQSSTSIQDDMAIISSQNGFGYRDDGIGHSLGAATGWGKGTQFTATGIITQTTVGDFYSFNIQSGDFTASVDVAPVGPTLHAMAELLDSSGHVIATADSNDSLGATLSAKGLGAGTYYLEVASHGSYGDVGSYSVSASVQSDPPPVPPLTAAGQRITATAGQTFSGVVAFAVDGNTNAAGNLVATINWGDGTSHDKVSLVGPNARGQFGVAASHTYANAGIYTISITIQDTNDGKTVSVSPSAFVANPAVVTVIDAPPPNEPPPSGNPPPGNPPPVTGNILVLNADQSLWQDTSRGPIQISAAGSVLAISAGPTGTVFAVGTDHSLWQHGSSGWLLLAGPGQVLMVSAGSDSANVPVVDAIGTNLSLWQHGAQGWTELAGPGQVQAVSAGSNGTVFAIGTDQSLWQHSASTWSELAGPGTTLSIGAGSSLSGPALIFAVGMDHSLWEGTAAGWAELASPGSVEAISSQVGDALFASGVDNSLWELSLAGWAELSAAGTPAGSAQVFGPGLTTSGKKVLFAVADDQSLWEFTGSTWAQMAPAGTATAFVAF